MRKRLQDLTIKDALMMRPSDILFIQTLSNNYEKKGAMDMRKSGNLRMIMAAALILACVMAIAGCGKQQSAAGSDSEQSKSAQTALEHVLSCTVQEAADFETASEEIKQAAAETGDETGMISVDGLETYFQGRFGDELTKDCLNRMMADRTIAVSIKLAEQYQADIQAEDIQLTKRSGAEDMYDFEAKLVTSDDSKQVAKVTGVVAMEESQSSWKISNLTLKVTDVTN